MLHVQPQQHVIRDVAIADSGTHCALVTACGRVKLWDIEYNKCAFDLDTGQDAGQKVAMSALHAWFCTSGPRGTVHAWDFRTTTPVARLPVRDQFCNSVNAMAMSSDNNCILVAHDYMLYLWDSCAGKYQKHRVECLGDTLAVSLSEHGGYYAASVHTDGTVAFWGRTHDTERYSCCNPPTTRAAVHVNEYGDFEYIAVCDYNTCWRHGVEPESNWMASLVLPDTDADTIPAVSKGKRVAATANARCPAPVVMHTPPTKDDPSHHSRKSEALPKPVVALAVSGGWPNQTAEIIVACTDSDIYIWNSRFGMESVEWEGPWRH